jgi:Arc/MetJ-type ribon-helix-helix transcriptional regulator
MAQIEVDIPTRLDTEIEQLVDEDEFLSRQEAIEDLLSTGLQSYSIDDEDDEGDLAFADEMTNPGERPMGHEEEDGGDDDYTF